jgi:hypothetical protein
MTDTRPNNAMLNSGESCVVLSSNTFSVGDSSGLEDIRIGPGRSAPILWRRVLPISIEAGHSSPTAMPVSSTDRNSELTSHVFRQEVIRIFFQFSHYSWQSTRRGVEAASRLWPTVILGRRMLWLLKKSEKESLLNPSHQCDRIRVEAKRHIAAVMCQASRCLNVLFAMVERQSALRRGELGLLLGNERSL